MKFKNPFTGLKKDKLILIFLVGVLLVVIKIPTKSTNKNTTGEYNIQNSATVNSNDDYKSRMEAELEALLSSANGVGKTKVIITYKDSGKNILQIKDTETSSEKSEKEASPEILGVLIVAEGAGNIEVVSEITNAVSVLLGIPVNKIKILKMEA